LYSDAAIQNHALDPHVVGNDFFNFVPDGQKN
jgi:hypothetical protein